MKNLLITLLCLCIVGCGQTNSAKSYKSVSLNGSVIQYTGNKLLLNKDNVLTKEYCTYFLSYFIPINFWNIRFFKVAYIKKAIRELNNEGHNGNKMKDIFVFSNNISTPIFSYSCTKISGELANE